MSALGESHVRPVTVHVSKLERESLLLGARGIVETARENPDAPYRTVGAWGTS